jgi:hypothetical protein
VLVLGESGFRKCPINDDLLVGRPRVPPSAKPFRTQSADSMGALGKFEVILGNVVKYVNGQSRRELFCYKTECDGETHDPAFT